MKAILEIMYYDIETDEHCVEFEEVTLSSPGNEPSMIQLKDVTGQEDRRAIIHICDDVDTKYAELKRGAHTVKSQKRCWIDALTFEDTQPDCVLDDDNDNTRDDCGICRDEDNTITCREECHYWR